ncbi:MAG: protein-glutamate O-methyltransferase CheR [Lachnospiraceae bacterium]|nr:protein-glutamate O-methyltransferase CheR [Lachnospiraceae bacterium]
MNFSENEFQQIVSFIKQNYGVNLADKKTLVEGRLSSVLARSGYRTCSEFLRQAFRDPQGEEVTTLVNSLTTNHTFFLREPEHFHFLKDVALPELAEKNKLFKDLGIWSAAASSGEEAFTIAMTIRDFFGPDAEKWDTTILATDISKKALSIAAKGEYDAERVSTLPATWISAYFKSIQGDRFRVCDELRRQVLFRHFNLMEEFRFKRKFHIIFLRNVMIYFDEPTKDELLRKVSDVLEPGGYLFIGTTEVMGRDRHGLTCVQPSIYRK